MKGEKLHVIICIILVLAGVVGCAFFSIQSALIMLATALVIGTGCLCVHSAKRNKIMKLCDDIDRILRGSDEVYFCDYDESDISLLAAEIHKMTIRLREQNHALNNEKIFLKESLEDIAHQLRTPLTTMMLLVEMLCKPKLSERQRSEHLKELYSLLSRMNWLIDTMLGFSRIEAGVVNFRKESVDCRRLIDEAISPVAIPMDIKGITVDIQILGEPVISGDFQYLTEALLNILKNCTEHTPEGGKITVTAQENPIYTGIIITDSGKGFSDEDLQHVFDRFYRSGNSGGSGYGIGLAFARKIITAQNGSLQVCNCSEGGALFDIRIYHSGE